jgi:2-dehydropantoate 2-reductase
VRVVVLGAGSLGSLYAAWSADAGHDVTIVGRPAHVEAVNRAGLAVRARSGATRIVAVCGVVHAEQAPDADVVLLASKGPDSASLLEAYPGSPSAAWSIQNGARQSESIAERFGSAAIGCSSMVGATLTSPGVVAHTFEGATYIGSLPNSAPQSVVAVASSLSDDAGIVVRDDIDAVLWSKAVLATGAMGMSILLRLPYHHVFVEPHARECFYDIVADASQVAAAAGVALVDLPGPLQAGSLMAAPRAEALERLAELGAHMVEAGQTSVRVSMLQSLESGRRLEVQAVFGDLIERADEHGLEVPVLRAVHNVAVTLDEVAARCISAAANDGDTTTTRSQPMGLCT